MGEGMPFASCNDMATDESLPHAAEAPFAQLEQSLIREYLLMSGHDPDSMAQLPVPEREALLKEASLYASGKLSEVELRSQFVHGLHEAIGDVPKAGKA
jgi:hypothetical protein